MHVYWDKDNSPIKQLMYPTPSILQYYGNYCQVPVV